MHPFQGTWMDRWRAAIGGWRVLLRPPVTAAVMVAVGGPALLLLAVALDAPARFTRAVGASTEPPGPEPTVTPTTEPPATVPDTTIPPSPDPTVPDPTVPDPTVPDPTVSPILSPLVDLLTGLLDLELPDLGF